VCFSFEVGLKLLAERFNFIEYFKDGWNRFDFVIVVLCDLFRLPFMPDVGGILTMLRLLRLLRVLQVLPELRLVIEALMAGGSSLFFVLVILFITYFVFAIIGIMLFARNDPSHFGNLQLALLTLFRLATFDNWSDFLYINMYGCDQSGIYYFGQSAFYPDRPKQAHKYKTGQSKCNHPFAWGWVAVAYLIFFAVLGGMVLLTLFIGVVVESMEEAKGAFEEERHLRARLRRRCAAIGLDPKSKLVGHYRKVGSQARIGSSVVASQRAFPR
jgi:voltage-gated sodium channel